MDFEKGIMRGRRMEKNTQKRMSGMKGPRLRINQQVKSNPKRGGGINRPLRSNQT